MTTTPNDSRPMPASTPECIAADCCDYHEIDCPHRTARDIFLESRDSD